jgi:hypothetical protein
MLNQSFTENFQSTTSKSPFTYFGERDLEMWDLEKIIIFGV